jgi:hypothetical protein
MLTSEIITDWSQQPLSFPPVFSAQAGGHELASRLQSCNCMPRRDHSRNFPICRGGGTDQDGEAGKVGDGSGKLPVRAADSRLAGEFRLISLTNPPKSSEEGLIDYDCFDDDERQLIKKYLSLGDPDRKSPSKRTRESKGNRTA